MKVSGINLYKPRFEAEVNQNFTSPSTHSRDTISRKEASSLLKSCLSGLVTVFTWIAGLTLLQWAWAGITFLFKAMGCCFGKKEPAIAWDRVQMQAKKALSEAKDHLEGTEKVALFLWNRDQTYQQFLEPAKIDSLMTILEEKKKSLMAQDPLHLGLFLIPKDEEKEGLQIVKSLSANGVQGNRLHTPIEGDRNNLNKLFQTLKGNL